MYYCVRNNKSFLAWNSTKWSLLENLKSQKIWKRWPLLYLRKEYSVSISYQYIWIEKKRCLLTSEWKINSQILHIELDVALEIIWK